jgi:hypothetical protein
MNEVLLAFVDSNGKSHKITISGDFATTSKTNDRFCSPQMLKAGVACLRGIRVELGSEGKSLNITSPTEVSIGEVLSSAALSRIFNRALNSQSRKLETPPPPP